MKKIYTILFVVAFFSVSSFAGNPDRQGEAGAYELLMNPWARSAGLHTMNTGSISGVEAMRLNIAGLSRINKTEIGVGFASYLKGTGLSLRSLGLSQKVGAHGAFGVSLMSVGFGDIAVTTVANPEGTGATYSPSFFHLGLGYAHTFENKVSVGVLFRAVSESTTNVKASGFAIDAGVQYVAGDKDEFKFGIALRNVGTPMRFTGEGLGEKIENPAKVLPYNLLYSKNASQFEMPSVLNIGASYDILPNENIRVTVLGNFTSNAFSRDDVGGGAEIAYKKLITIRGAYKYTIGLSPSDVDAPVYTGLSAGFSVNIPSKKRTTLEEGEIPSMFAVDYAYRASRFFEGTHNITLRISLGSKKKVEK